MKRTIILCFAFFGLFFSTTARPVDLQTAQSIASKFMGTNNVRLSTTYSTGADAAAFHVFNTPDGFVIVSADDCETPIIGYSHEGRFDPNNVPVQMEDYLRDFVARIQYGIENHIEADELTAKQWELVRSTGRLSESKSNHAVGPLLTEKWHQGCLYNSLCPAMSGPCGHAEVGCVAVAMAQIMHYWGYPASGWGTHSYYNQGVELSADFGNTTYDWEHMPDSLTESSNDLEIEAVATLLYHCGISVKMDYGTDGSYANSSIVPDAMMRYFSYSRRIHREKKADYNNEEWLSMLKSSFDSSRPVYYSGSGSAGGHAFVCDGYDDNDLLHFNWGWGGNGDGYFALGNMNPIGYSFNNKNYAIFDIIPEYEPCVVEASAYPPTAGTIEGSGEYHFSDLCTLTAIPNENCEFKYWKQNGRILSYNSSYSLEVKYDVDNIEAHFYYMPLKEIIAYHAPDTNDVNSPYVSLSWDYDNKHNWTLLKQFPLHGERGVTTDDEFIYTCKQNYDTLSNPVLDVNKYNKHGDLLETVGINDVNTSDITCDGNYLYFGNNHILSFYLYGFDIAQQTMIDSINMDRQVGTCAYDALYDGFWITALLENDIVLMNRQGETLASVTTSTNYYWPNGFGSIVAEDGNPHLLIVYDRTISDYDISDNSFNKSIILDYPGSFGACLGKYDGKDALFSISFDYSDFNYNLFIFEINSHLAPIHHYRLYRANLEGDTLMLADEVSDSYYSDTTWSNVNAGIYRFGISEVYFNGVESDIIWSDTIVKAGIGIKENNDGPEDSESPVRKIVEDGQIIIIKDEKRYNVSGQTLK